MKSSASILTLVLLSACGSGSDGGSVEPVPAAEGTPGTVTPITGPAPAKPVQAPGATTAPAVTPIPTTVSPAPPPAPAQPVALPDEGRPPGQPPVAPVGPTLSGALLLKALTDWIDPSGGNPIAWGIGRDGSVAIVQQRSHGNPVDPPIYFNGSLIGSGEGTHLTTATMFLPSWDSTGRVLGAVFNAENTVELVRAEGAFQILPGDVYVLDSTIAEWRAGQWFQQLQIQSDGGGGRYKVCWHFRLPTFVRLTCTKNGPDGLARGIHLVDDSDGRGPQTWTTP